MLRRAAAIFALFLAVLLAPAAGAQVFVVQTCGTIPAAMGTLTATHPGWLTVDTNGNFCGNIGTQPTGGATHAQPAALAANLVVKAAPGSLFSFQVSADSTLSAAAWWIMIYDAASAPADGAVTPAKCYALPSGATGFTGAFDTGGVNFATGIVIGVSTTGCFSKTASTHAFIGADYQ